MIHVYLHLVYTNIKQHFIFEIIIYNILNIYYMKKKVFSEEDFNSNDGMVTSIWGPSLWHVLHTISFNYPANPTSDDKLKYYNFFISLGDVLPCGACRINYKDNLKKVKLTKDALKDRKSFSKWVYDLHNHINEMTGSKYDKSFNETRELYENFRARCVKRNGKSAKEDGCTESLYGIKSKVKLNIVPKSTRGKTFKVDEKCKVKRAK